MGITINFLFTQDYITKEDGKDYPISDLFHKEKSHSEIYELEVLPRVGEIIKISCNGEHQFRVREVIHHYLIEDKKSTEKLEYSYALILLEPIPFSKWIDLSL
jgi:hypothetical protein